MAFIRADREPRDPTAQADETAASPVAAAAPQGDSVTDGDRLTLPVIEESLEVGKRVVARGGYRLTKHVDAKVETIDELLRNHRVEIERIPINAPLGSDDLPEPRYEGDTLVVPVIEEVIVTEKRLVLTEEIRITRVAGTHRRPQQVTLRKERIEIERLEPASDDARAAPGSTATDDPAVREPPADRTADRR
jgi:uncharacterized protein (TIGR02271 family)